MKKLVLFLVCSFLVVSLACCSSTNVKNDTTSNEVVEKTDLVVFAAASMTETLNQIKEQYEKENSNVNIVYNFDSSGTLKTQIETGADCDVFISAAPKQMNQLDITADKSINTSGLDFVDKSTRINLLENKVALAVPSGNKANIESYDQLIDKLKNNDIFLAIGNSDVPVGQYTEKIFDYYGLDKDELMNNGCLTLGSNVKEVTTQVKENTVDCGIIYQTDAFSAKLEVVDTATKDMCGQVIYPAAVLKISKNKDEAVKYLNYLKSDYAKNVFKSVGFTPLT